MKNSIFFHVLQLQPFQETHEWRLFQKFHTCVHIPEFSCLTRRVDGEPNTLQCVMTLTVHRVPELLTCAQNVKYWLLHVKLKCRATQW